MFRIFSTVGEIKRDRETKRNRKKSFTIDILTTPLRDPSCRCPVRVVAVADAVWSTSNVRLL